MTSLRFTLNWRMGLLVAVAFVIIGIGLFVFVGSRVDYNCTNSLTKSAGCQAYNGFNRVMAGYADFWLQFVAKRCVGGNGPDDCIGPNIGIMFWTLACSGFIIGGTSRRKQKK